VAFFGIDLGTTNSLVATIVEGKPKLIPNPLGQFLTPSCVGVDDTGAVLVGQAAKERLITHRE
jgi:molecular chaperone HscC